MISVLIAEALQRFVDERSAFRTRFEPTVDEVAADLEPSVLDDLADLTALHGPWMAAQTLFNKITEGASDVA